MQLDQRSYWDKAAHTKVFNHPLNSTWLEEIPRDVPLLDVGCGYGRIVGELEKMGFEKLLGVDPSKEMIQKAKTHVPFADFQVMEPGILPFPDQRVAGVFLFAVLTCIPHTEDQMALIQEIHRVLIPGGFVYVSDLLLNEDQRNRSRYEKALESYPCYGVFELPEGAVCRHHTESYLKDTLFQSFSLQKETRFQVKTMNGNDANAIQLLLMRPI